MSVGVPLRVRNFTGSVVLLALVLSALLGAVPAAAQEVDIPYLGVTPATNLPRAVPSDVDVSAVSFPANTTVELAYCSFDDATGAESCHGQLQVESNAKGAFNTSITVDYQYLATGAGCAGGCYVAAFVGGDQLAYRAITFATGPELGVAPSTHLAAGGATVFVRGMELPPNAPLSLVQCAGPRASLSCTATDQGGSVWADGDFVQDGMQVSYSTGAFETCPEGECFVRASEKQPYTETLGEIGAGRLVETRCPPGERLTGVRADLSVPGFSDYLVSRIAPVCGATEGAFIGRVTDPAPDEYSSCPTDQVVTGVSGRQGQATDAIAVRCQALDAAHEPTGPETYGEQVGGSGGTAIDPGPSCPERTVAIGLHGKELLGWGDPLYEVGLICDHLPTEPFTLLSPIAFYLPIDVAGLTVSADAPSSLPGARRIPTGNIPASTIPANQVPFIGATPLRSIDIEAAPLRSIPLRSIPLRSIPLRSIPLRSIMLSSIPLRSIGWTTILEGTPLADVPLQTVSLEALLDDPVASERFLNLDLATVDLSATPLRSISVLSLAMGATPLRSIPLRSIGPNETADHYAEWCAFLASLPDPVSCSHEGFTADTPIMALDLAGVPLRSIPLRSIPLRSIPLRSIDLEAAPLRSIPLRSIAIQNTPLRSIPLRSIAVAGTPLRSIPLRSIDASVLAPFVDCTSTPALCDLTIGQALDQGVLGGDVTLGDIFAGLAADADLGTLGELLDLVWADESIELGTLGDILLGLVLAGDFPWEELPLVKMGAQRYGSDPRTVGFDVSYTVTNGDSVSDHTIEATLPPGFAYEFDSAVLLYDGLDAAQEPTVSGDPVAGETLRWELPNAPRGAVHVSFAAVAGLRIGNAGNVTATVTADDGTASDAATASSGDVAVRAPTTDSFSREFTGGDGTFDSPRPVALNTLELGYIQSADEVDYFSIPAPEPGTRLSVRLSHLSADADLVLYGPASAANEDVVNAAPLRSIPLRSIPLEDERLTGEAVPPETLQDIPLRSIPLRSISANRSDADEEIDITSTALGGSYIVQVSGYNGATSNDPYVLRVRTHEPPPAPECTTTVDLTGTTPGVRSADNPDAETLILLNEQRLHALHPAEAAAVRTSLDNLAADDNVNGVVLPVDSVAAVAAAYSAWDAAACSPEKANAVVREITSVVHTFARNHPQLRSVVLVGGDDLLPMARLDDTTSLSNERDYAGDTAGPNPITGAFATEHILSDDPYGDSDPIEWLNRRLYVPDYAVGRLVETPAEIIGQVEQFIAVDGQLDPKTALTTGYDFLTDGAEAVTDELQTSLPLTGVQSLISEDWTTGDVSQQMFGSGDAPDIASINAHYDHYRSLPADQNAAGTETDLFTVADIPAANGAASTLAGRILFTMGCHAGLSVPDRYVAAGGPAQDWVQTFSAQRAIYVANTGFGYGDTAAVALSERLMALFAGELGHTESVGAALAAAKSEYFASMGVYGSYDEKAMAEATFYGLPMYRIGPKTAPASDTAAAATATATDVQDVTLTPAFTSTTDARGRFWSVNGDVQVTHYRPIQPRTSVDITRPGQVAHGAVIEDLRSADIVGVDPVFARPTVDLAEHEPEIESADVVFPTSLHTISTVGQGDDLQQRLVVMPGQFFGHGDDSTSGVQRLFTRVDASVLYGAANEEFVAPTIEQISAASTGGTAQFSVDVRDASGVERVLVLFRDTTNAWTPVELTADSGGVWRGSGTAASDEIEYFVQAVDAFGNVAQSTNKGRYFHAFAGSGDGDPIPGPDPADDLVVEFSGDEADDGWWSSDVTLTPSGASFYRLDEGTWQSLAGVGAITIAAEGVTRVDFAGSGQNVIGTHEVRIDRVAPVITGTAPAEGALYWFGQPVSSNLACSDAGSGVRSCLQQSVVQTSVEGAQTYTIVARDKAGNVARHTVSYTVGPELVFGGFRAPVDTQKANLMRAGAAVPVKWAMQYTDGVYERSTEGITWTSVPVDCLTGATDSVEQLVSASGSSLKYDTTAEQYVLTWKTDKGWTGCRKLMVDIPKVGTKTALFQFK